MKKVLFLTISSVLFLACMPEKNSKEQKTIDSLTVANEQLKHGYEDLLSDINDINAGFQQMSETEERINSISFDENGETKSNVPTQNIKENMEFIVQLLEDNKSKIALLESKLADATYSSEQLQTMVNSLKQQMEEKQQEIMSLKNLLVEKNVQIGKMGTQIDNLVKENTSVKNENTQIKQENEQVKTENQTMKEENQKVKQENQDVKNENEAVKSENQAVKSENEKVKKENKEKETILANQDAQINAAFYAIGTKKELKEKNILSGGEILTKSNFDKSYFTKIDIRNTTTIKLNAKRAELLSNHPASSYALLKDATGDITLKVNSPSEFWSLTKYLVVRVK